MSSKWEIHKRRIEELYLIQGKKLNEVKYIMENEHGFSASKAGYERQLKKWGLRKNQKHENLKLIKCRLEASQQQGKEIEVYIGGRKLEVQKKVDRCFITVLEKYNLERAKTPPGLVFVTKESGLSRELPWQFFVRQLNSINNLEMIINMPEDMLRNMVHVTSFYPNPSPQVPENLQQLIHYLSAIMPMDLDNDIMDFLRKIFSGDYRIATIEFLKLAVYVLSNKLLDNRTRKGYIFCERLLRWFQMRHNYRFLQSILAQKTPTIEAFMENIFASTVYDEDGHLLEIFLESGTDPNIAIPDRDERGEASTWSTITALQYFARRNNVHLARKIVDKGASVNFNSGAALIQAVGYGSIGVVKLLIGKGVNVNQQKLVRWDFLVDSALQIAASQGNLEIARMLLDNGAEINATSVFNGCALSLAAEAGSMDLVEMLLYRADINCRPVGDGDTPIQAAAITDNHALVERLLRMGAEADARGRWGRTALQWACAYGNLEMSRTLILAGADVNAAPNEFRTTKEGQHRIEDRATALIAAVISNNHQLVSFLLENGADVNDSRAGRTALETAARWGNVQMVQLLLSAGADPRRDNSLSKAIGTKDVEPIRTSITAGADVRDNRGTNALCAAVCTGDVELVHVVLGLGAHPNRGDDDDGRATPLVCAVERANLPMVDALLEAGADCNHIQVLHKWPDRDLNALQMASVKGHSEIVKRLLDSGADINWPAGAWRGRTALQAAVEFGEIELIQFLIRRKADINAPPAEGGGLTALQAAVQQSKVDLVRILLEAGAKPNSIRPAYNRELRSCGSPLQIAAGKGDVLLVQLLLAFGADVNLTEKEACDDDCQTALQAAARNGHYETVKLLLREGAHVHAANENSGDTRITPLQAAAGGGYVRIAKALLDAGADVNELGFMYQNKYHALESAAGNGRIDMIKLLLNAGADITSGLGRDTLDRALRKAKRNGHNAAAKFLKSHQII